MRLLLIMPLLALAGCCTPGGTSSTTLHQPPTPPAAKPLCPAAITAKTEAEPLPPHGVSSAALHQALVAISPATGDAFFQWLAVDHPTWGRLLAGRLDQAQADCAKAEAAPKP